MAGNANITLTIKGADFPSETPATLATATVDSTTKQNHVRGRAREIILRISGDGTGYGWSMGDLRVDMRTDGKR